MTDAPMTDAAVRASVARAEKATRGPWRSMRDGNQYLDGREMLVGASRVDGLPRVWSEHYVVPPSKLEHVSRFKDADADFIAASRTDVVALGNEVLRLREAARAYCDHIDSATVKIGNEYTERGQWLYQQLRAALPATQENPQ